LPIGEEEQLVSLHRTSEVRTEIVELKLGQGGGSPGSRVEQAVTQELQCRTVKDVRAGLGHDFDLTTRAAALIGAIDRTAGAELSNRFDGNLQSQVLLFELMIDAGGIHAIHVEVVVFL